jgi:RNA polymerase sigma factor (sigma-70 family)
MDKKQNPTDRFLIEQYLEGRTSVLPILVKRYHKIFCKKAYWIIKDRETAKDTVQDSWITIIHKLHTLEHLDSFKIWALRIVYTKSIDSLKHRNKENKSLRSFEMIDSYIESSEDESSLIKIALLKSIQELPKEKQDIIRLFYREEYSIAEIGNFLNIPVGTVKSRLFKAREKLKSILNK